MEKITLRIGGMHCGACAAGIQMNVSQLVGVVSIFVDYNTKKAMVEFDSAKITKEKIIAAITELGYTAD